MRRSSYVGTPALVCDGEQPCRRALWLQFIGSTFGRAVIILWIVLVGAGVLASLTGCDPRTGNPDDPRPLQTGEQPAPMYTVIRPK